MRHIVPIGIVCAAGLAAGAAHAQRAPEARNPFHCSIALQVAHSLVSEAQGADAPLTRELHARLVWQAMASARFPKAADAEVQADALRSRFSENRDEGLAMAEACMRRQDAHPKFQAARVEQQIREGERLEAADSGAALVALRDVYRQPEAAASGSQP